jgi:hypothetical protein
VTDVNRRVLIAGASVLAVLAALFIAGYFLLADRNGDSPKDASPSPSPTDPRSEIEQAYLRFWDVYAKAALELDADPLNNVASGEALRLLKAQVEEQRGKNQPFRVRVEHNYQIVFPIPGQGDDTASVDDRYVNHTVRLDPQTKEPIEPDPNAPTHDTYTLKKVNGKWMVTEIIEHR